MKVEDIIEHRRRADEVSKRLSGVQDWKDNELYYFMTELLKSDERITELEIELEKAKKSHG